MHLRLVKARSGQETRRYAQLVQSYRRPDGVPAQRVVASLGQLSDQEVHNLRLALEASRQDKALVLPIDAPWRPRVLANLAYLDVAVALELWQSWRLSELLHRLIPEQNVQVRAAELIAALTIQRCVAPGSKLEAQRWFPRTALPELMGIAPAHFNNSRIHRALEDLDRVDSALQEALPRRYVQRHGAFSAVFSDVSDAYFEGRGCDLADRGGTKEGLRNRYKVGILLLCNERGYPLRWKVLPGRTQDGKALADVVPEIETLPWANDVPVIFDRAMGTQGAVARLVQSNLRFMTAARRSEIGSYTDALPTAVLSDLGGSDDESEHQRLMALAAQRVLDAGMQKVHDELYVLDLGVAARRMSIAAPSLIEEGSLDMAQLEGGAAWLALARQYREQLENKEFPSQARLAAHLGVTRARMCQIMSILRLDEELQREVLAGHFGYIPDRTLRVIVNLRGKAKQRRALEEHAVAARPMGNGSVRRALRRSEFEAELRLVVYFNPRMFVDQRTLADKHLRDVQGHVADLNRRLRRARVTRTRESIYAEVTSKLESLSLLSVFDVDINEVFGSTSKHLEVALRFDEEAWRRRRRYDGFVLLVAHPALMQSGVELVQLYRAKDAVEKDFQTIKTDLKLRPVFHYTDPKVRAHVTLCMLALLLERTLEASLRRAGQRMTAPACFDELAAGHLNLLATDPDAIPAYLLTEPTGTQRALLEHLGMGHLADQAQLTERLHPRQAE